MTEPEPTQRTRFWLAFFYPSALAINAGIIAAVLVLVMPRVHYGFQWAAAAAAVLSLILAFVKAVKFKRRYSL